MCRLAGSVVEVMRDRWKTNADLARKRTHQQDSRTQALRLDPSWGIFWAYRHTQRQRDTDTDTQTETETDTNTHTETERQTLNAKRPACQTSPTNRRVSELTRSC